MGEGGGRAEAAVVRHLILFFLFCRRFSPREEGLARTWRWRKRKEAAGPRGEEQAVSVPFFFYPWLERKKKKKKKNPLRPPPGLPHQKGKKSVCVGGVSLQNVAASCAGLGIVIQRAVIGAVRVRGQRPRPLHAGQSSLQKSPARDGRVCFNLRLGKFVVLKTFERCASFINNPIE